MKSFIAICCALGALHLVKSDSLLARANDEFGLRLLQHLEAKLSNSKENIFISPFSIGTTLAMLLAGGAKETYTQIYDALDFNSTNLTNFQLFHEYKNLTDELNKSSRSRSAILTVANGIAIQKNFAMNEDFISNITTYFEAQVAVEDFSLNATKATADINGWISDKTQDNVAQLFDSELHSTTAIVLLSTLYFKGIWKTKFEIQKTPSGLYMTQKGQFNYAQLLDGIGQMIELPYQNQTRSMYVFLPPTNFNRSISSLFTAPKLEQAIAQLQPQIVNLFLPAFTVYQNESLATTLEAFGISDAFTSKADFFNINGDFNLRISQVIHKAYIEVNGEGTEAAAASAAVIEPPVTSVDASEIDFKADHPFMFLIRDNVANLTIFSGIVNNPGK